MSDKVYLIILQFGSERTDRNREAVQSATPCINAGMERSPSTRLAVKDQDAIVLRIIDLMDEDKRRVMMIVTTFLGPAEVTVADLLLVAPRRYGGRTDLSRTVTKSGTPQWPQSTYYSSLLIVGMVGVARSLGRPMAYGRSNEIVWYVQQCIVREYQQSHELSHERSERADTGTRKARRTYKEL